LREDLKAAEQAVAIARDTATHPDALGSSKYETMGLEASYLAQGQGLRLLEIERNLGYFSRLKLPPAADAIGLNTLLRVVDEADNARYLWLAPEAGGLKVAYETYSITVVTPKSPLGATLIGRKAGEIVELRIDGRKCAYCIEAVA
jgi:hypothetical protein